MQSFLILLSLCSRAEWREPYLVASSDTDFLTSRAHSIILKRIIVRFLKVDRVNDDDNDDDDDV